MELQANLGKIREQGLGLAAISYDSPAILKDFSTRKAITFPLLSDTDSRVIRAWGLLNETVARDSMQFGIPYPGTFILNRDGSVRSKFFEDDYRERYTASEILVRQFGVAGGTPQTEIETKHLKLHASASLTTVHWGQRLALTMDVDLKPGMHVYAPGVKGYIPIDWTLAESPAFKPHEAAYPPSKMLHLDAIQETVPVYQGHFRLIRDITIAPDAQVKPVLNEKGAIEVHANFHYQACDEKTCYIPQTIPLTFMLQYEALDRQRAPAEVQHKSPK